MTNSDHKRDGFGINRSQTRKTGFVFRGAVEIAVAGLAPALESIWKKVGTRGESGSICRALCRKNGAGIGMDKRPEHRALSARSALLGTLSIVCLRADFSNGDHDAMATRSRPNGTYSRFGATGRIRPAIRLFPRTYRDGKRISARGSYADSQREKQFFC